MVYFVLCLLPLAIADDTRSVEQIAKSIEEGISLLHYPVLSHSWLQDPLFLEGMRTQIAKGDSPSIEQETPFFEGSLGVAGVLSLRHLLLHPVRRDVLEWRPLKRLLGNIRHQYERRETPEKLTRAKTALLGLEAVVSYQSDTSISPAEVYAVMYQLAAFPPMLEHFHLSEIETKAAVIESLAGAYEGRPATGDARPYFILSAIQSLRGLLSEVPLSVAVDPEGIPFEPTTRLYFPSSSSENPIQALASLKYFILARMDDLRLRSKAQRLSERDGRIESRKVLIRHMDGVDPFNYADKKKLKAQRMTELFLSRLNRLEIEANQALGKANVLEAVTGILQEAQQIYRKSSKKHEKEIAHRALAGLLNTLKFPISEGYYTDLRVIDPLDFIEIISLCWKSADNLEKKLQVLEAIAVLEKRKPQYADNAESSFFTEENCFGKAFHYRVLEAWSGLLYAFWPPSEDSTEEVSFRGRLYAVKTANMHRLSLSEVDLLKKIRARAPERFCRAERENLSPLQKEIHLKMSLIECIPAFLQEAERGKIGDYIPESVFLLLEDGDSNEADKKLAFEVVSGLHNLFEYSITEQLFSPVRLTRDPVLLLDFYRVFFGFLNGGIIHDQEPLLKSCFRSIAAFKGEWAKDWDKPEACPLIVLDAFSAFLDEILSHLTSHFCQSATSPDEWAFASRLPWVKEPSSIDILISHPL